MSTETLTHDMIDLPYFGRAWRVSGARGAVTVSQGGVEFHSPVPWDGGIGPMPHCPAVDFPCYYDGGSARPLLARWEDAGRDEGFMRAEMERMYLSELPEPSAVR